MQRFMKSDPVFTTIAKFNRTKKSFEHYLRTEEHTEELTEEWHERFEADLEVVAKTIPVTYDGFKASAAELCKQVKEDLGRFVVSIWIESLGKSFKNIEYKYSSDNQIAHQ